MKRTTIRGVSTRRLTPPERVEHLQRLRLRAHRLQPSRPLRSIRAAVGFVQERRIVLATGRSSLPMLAETIIGAPIAGSWMAHPAVFRIHRVLRAVSRSGLLHVPLILGKETILAPSLGPAVERLASDEQRRATARAPLPPVARRLLEEVERRGRVRMDQWKAPAKEARLARLLLMRQLLVTSREMHTEKGYHTAIVTPWADSDVSRRFARAAHRITIDEALDGLLVAGVRSAVLAPEREVRRWLPFGTERIDALVAQGSLTRDAAGRTIWLSAAQ